MNYNFFKNTISIVNLLSQMMFSVTQLINLILEINSISNMINPHLDMIF